jgi:MoaA/NifB/PqqE/SkfB family radical SAM enzyme
MKLSRFTYNFHYAVNWRKPRLTLRIMQAYVDLLLRGRQPMRSIDVNIGLACNLRCTHCFAENLKFKGATVLTNEEWGDVFEQAIELGTISIAFTGGEPMISPRLFELIPLAQPDRMLVILATNATLLSPGLAARLKAAGVDLLQISVDSGIAEEHDRFRGKNGAFAATMRAIDIARAAGLKVAASPTVSHLNIDSPGFQRVIDWARREGILVNLSLAVPVGEWAGHDDCLLTPEDMERLNRLVRTTPHVRRDFETNYWTQGCGAATEKLYVSPFGDVLACPYMHISFGNVREARLADIRAKMLENPYLKDFHPRCLTAEDREFIDNYLPREFLQDRPLPRSETVFANLPQPRPAGH